MASQMKMRLTAVSLPKFTSRLRADRSRPSTVAVGAICGMNRDAMSPPTCAPARSVTWPLKETTLSVTFPETVISPLNAIT